MVKTKGHKLKWLQENWRRQGEKSNSIRKIINDDWQISMGLGAGALKVTSERWQLATQVQQAVVTMGIKGPLFPAFFNRCWNVSNLHVDNLTATTIKSKQLSSWVCGSLRMGPIIRAPGVWEIILSVGVIIKQVSQYSLASGYMQGNQVNDSGWLTWTRKDSNLKTYAWVLYVEKKTCIKHKGKKKVMNL